MDRRTPVALFSLAILAAYPTVSWADHPQPDDRETPPKVETKVDVEEKIEAETDPLISPDPLEPTLEFIKYRTGQDWLAEHGVEFGLGLTLVWQAATDVEDDANNLFTYSFDIEAVWTVFTNDTTTGSVGFLADGGHALFHHHDESLNDNVGGLFGVNADQDDEDIRVAELWYAHGFGNVVDDESGAHQYTLVVGKIDQTSYLDTNRIANDETAQFLSTPLLNNPAIPFPDRGLGFNFTATLANEFYVSGGYGDAAANASENGFNTIGDGDWFTAAEVGFTPSMNDRPGAYRLTVWGTGVDDEDGFGIALSADQEIAENVVPFARLGYGDEDVVDFEFFASAGVGFENFGRQGNLLAVGAAYGRTGDDQEQSLVEAFYRFQLTDTIAITPDLQAVINPIDAGADIVFVGGARLQASF